MRKQQKKKEQQEGFTRDEIAKALGITTRTLDRRRKRGELILTPVSEEHYLYTVQKEQTEETGTDEQGSEQEPQQQEAATDQRINYTTALQPHFQSFRRMIDHELDFMEDQLAELRKHTDQRLAEVEDQLAELRIHTDQQLAELRSHTDQQIAELGKHIRTLVQLLRQLYETGNNQPA